MLLFIAACFLPAFAFSFAVTAWMRRAAPRWGLVDQPAARKVHLTPTPLGGGIGIYVGVVLTLFGAQLAVWLLLSPQGSPPEWLPAEIRPHLEGVLYRSGQLWAIIAAGTLLSVMGLFDDLRNLPWLPRLLLQLCVAAALVFGGVQATVFLPLPWVGIVVTVLWIIVLTNAFNFLDNMDGLSAGIAFIAALLFAAIMLGEVGEPRWLVGGLQLVLGGALGGFLVHNRPPAKIFMGDSGSYFIGLLLATTTVLGTFYEYNVSGGEAPPGRHVILAPLCLLAIPLYDFGSVLVIRLLEGRSPFHPDRSHFSHRLVELGLKPGHAVLTIYLATLMTGLGGVLLYHVDGWAGASLVIALIAATLAIVAILETAGRRTGGRK